jgi:hypothetical protein
VAVVSGSNVEFGASRLFCGVRRGKTRCELEYSTGDRRHDRSGRGWGAPECRELRPRSSVQLIRRIRRKPADLEAAVELTADLGGELEALYRTRA